MTACTDDERREVARRLRMSRSEWSGMCWKLWLGPKFGAVVLSDGNRDELEDVAHRLVDLIEPPTQCPYYHSDRHYCSIHDVPATPQKVAEEMFGKMCHSTKEEADAYDAMLKSKSVELHPVDRDALLALADKMSRYASLRKSHGMDVDTMAVMAWVHRIREALGVSDDA